MCSEKHPPEEVQKFVVFAIEEYRAAKNISGKDALELFETSGLLDYVEEFYDVLHSYGGEYLVHDLDEFLSRHSSPLL